MRSKIRIALYSGTIPSTPFVERLISGLLQEGFTVLLYGKIKDRLFYKEPNVLVIGNRDNFVGMLITIVRYIRLRLGDPQRFLKLRRHLAKGIFSSKASFRKWHKYLPVVLYLPDIFHVQWAKAAGEWFFLKELYNVRLVLSLRGSHINYSPLADEQLADMYRNILPKYDGYHGVSAAIVEEAKQYGVRPDDAVVIYSGVETAAFSSKRKFLRHKVMQILVVGRMHWIKGYHYLLDSLAILRERHFDAMVTLIAQGEMPEEILYQINELGIADRLVSKKDLPHKEVLKYMEEHDILVLSSVEEGIANVVLEAMNMGLPVISTDCGGMREVIRDGENGFMIPVRSPEAIAETILRYSELSVNEINDIRLRAHETIEQKFNIGKNMKAFTDLYSKVLACA